MTAVSITSKSLLTETDRCVMCGLCLPHCPTYVLTRNEAESPRGRIALVQGLLKGQLERSAALEQRLDHCLSCRACEAVCPSGVHYGVIIDGARAKLQATKSTPWLQRMLLTLVASPFALTILAWSLRLYEHSGLRRLLRAGRYLGARRLQALDALLPVTGPRLTLRPHYPAQGVERGRVALFAGCVAKAVDTATLASAIKVLTQLGYAIDVPAQQTCCGALHLHSGNQQKSLQLVQQNLTAFATTSQQPYEAIITLASACGITLKEYPLHTADAQAQQFAQRVMDIHQFLQGIEWPPGLYFQPLPKRVVVHDPCSLKNVWRLHHMPYQLLSRIPELQVITLPGNQQCCGAAGSYMLTEPEFAQALRAPKIEAIAALKPDILVSANIGCALHLHAGLREKGIEIEVLHPMTLLARQLKTSFK